MRLLTVVGNRPQFVKAAAVSKHLDGGRIEEVLVHTGQHYDPELSEVFFEELGLRPPEHELDVGSGTHAEQTGGVITALEPLVERAAPEAMLVYGDTNSTLGAALVAAKSGVPLAHVEAGMRSGDRSMPEEVNRVVTDSVADLLLCSTEVAVRNLEAEGLGERAELVGDVMADAAVAFGPVAERRSRILEKLGLEERAYSVATTHRPANVDDPGRLARVVEVLSRVAEEAPVVLAAHPRTRAALEGVEDLAGLEDRGIQLGPPLGYLDMACLVRASRLVVTDSGGLQKEAFLAAVPCLTLRETTEWTETVEAGWNRLIGIDPDRVGSALAELPAPGESSPALALYGEGTAGARIAELLATRFA